ncbi:MAG: hypothetical protein HC915_10225 [Anaerolineae bacterium]|nr:hypothetical protein [Anaerolineae bacterium]
MSNFFNLTFRNQTVEVDGNRYDGCTFMECRLVYRGGELPSFVRCDFDRVNFQLEGGAYQTLKYLTGMYHGGFSSQVEQSLGQMLGAIPEEPVRVRQYKAEAVGENWGQLAVWNAGLVLAAVIIVAMLFVGFVSYPTREVLGNDQPLREEVPAETTPNCPMTWAPSMTLCATSKWSSSTATPGWTRPMAS